MGILQEYTYIDSGDANTHTRIQASEHTPHVRQRLAEGLFCLQRRVNLLGEGPTDADSLLGLLAVRIIALVVLKYVVSIEAGGV